MDRGWMALCMWVGDSVRWNSKCRMEINFSNLYTHTHTKDTNSLQCMNWIIVLSPCTTCCRLNLLFISIASVAVMVVAWGISLSRQKPNESLSNWGWRWHWIVARKLNISLELFPLCIGYIQALCCPFMNRYFNWDKNYFQTGVCDLFCRWKLSRKKHYIAFCLLKMIDHNFSMIFAAFYWVLVCSYFESKW